MTHALSRTTLDETRGLRLGPGSVRPDGPRAERPPSVKPESESSPVGALDCPWFSVVQLYQGTSPTFHCQRRRDHLQYHEYSTVSVTFSTITAIPLEFEFPVFSHVASSHTYPVPKVNLMFLQDLQ